MSNLRLEYAHWRFLDIHRLAEFSENSDCSKRIVLKCVLGVGSANKSDCITRIDVKFVVGFGSETVVRLTVRLVESSENPDCSKDIDLQFVVRLGLRSI